MYMQHSEATASFLAANLEAPQPGTVSPAQTHHLVLLLFSTLEAGLSSGINAFWNSAFLKGTKGSFYVSLLQVQLLMKWKLGCKQRPTLIFWENTPPPPPHQNKNSTNCVVILGILRGCEVTAQLHFSQDHWYNFRAPGESNVGIFLLERKANWSPRYTW